MRISRKNKCCLFVCNDHQLHKFVKEKGATIFFLHPMLFFQFVLLSSSLFFLLDACVTFDNQNVATCKETPSVGIVGDVKLKCALVQPSAKADSSNCHGKYYNSIDIGMFNLENMNSLIRDHYETVKTLFQLFKKNVGLGQWRTLSIVLQDLLSSTERHFTLDKDWFDGLTDYKPSVFAVLLLGMIANDWTSINVTINEDIYDIRPPPKAIIFFLWNSSEVFCTISIFPKFLPQHINVSEPCREVVTVIPRSRLTNLSEVHSNSSLSPR